MEDKGWGKRTDKGREGNGQGNRDSGVNVRAENGITSSCAWSMIADSDAIDRIHACSDSTGITSISCGGWLLTRVRVLPEPEVCFAVIVIHDSASISCPARINDNRGRAVCHGRHVGGVVTEHHQQHHRPDQHEECEGGGEGVGVLGVSSCHACEHLVLFDDS